MLLAASTCRQKVNEEGEHIEGEDESDYPFEDGGFVLAMGKGEDYENNG